MISTSPVRASTWKPLATTSSGARNCLVAQSVEEYAKAWMIIEILRQWEPIAEYVGRTPMGPWAARVRHVGRLRPRRHPDAEGGGLHRRNAQRERRRSNDSDPRLPQTRAGVRSSSADIEFPPVISDTVTLSTFHGCPPDEIEQITKHLIDAHDLDVIVKLNPTLLGPAGVAGSCTVTSATTTCDLSRKPSRTTCISNGRSR